MKRGLLNLGTTSQSTTFVALNTSVTTMSINEHHQMPSLERGTSTQPDLLLLWF